jgi:hypothetical protein
LKRPVVVCGFGILVKEPVGIIKQPTVQNGFFDWFFDFWRTVVPGQNWFFDYSANCQSSFHYNPNLTHQFVVFESERTTNTGIYTILRCKPPLGPVDVKHGHAKSFDYLLPAYQDDAYMHSVEGLMAKPKSTYNSVSKVLLLPK